MSGDLSTPAAPAVSSGRQFRAQFISIVRLAAPVSLSRVGMLMLLIVDVAMVGRADSTELAYFALANAVQLVLFLIGVGMMVGTAVLTAQAIGAGARHECGPIWRVAVMHALLLGIGFGLLTLLGEWFFLTTGQEAGLAAGAGGVIAWMGLGLPAGLIYVCSTLFLEALDRPRMGLAAMAVANLGNIGLNWLLIEGQAGWPAMGAEGAALATAAARWLAALILVLYILRQPAAAGYGVLGPLTGGRAIGRKLRRLGYPMGLAQGLESAAFGTLVLLAGQFGALAVAGYQIAFNVIAFAFMPAIGIGTATAVRVGNAIGARDRAAMAAAGWSGAVAVLLAMWAQAIVVFVMPVTIISIFTSDAAVIALTVPVLFVAGFTMLTDGVQAVMMGALRGAADVWVPTSIQLCSFFLVMVPAAAVFAFPLGLGTPGLMAGAFCGVTLSATLLCLRFRVVSRREVVRL